MRRRLRILPRRYSSGPTRTSGYCATVRPAYGAGALSLRGAHLPGNLWPARRGAWHQASAVVVAAAALSGSMVRASPPAWLYEGAAVAAVLYALLFALGATAYRTLWVDLRELP